MIVSLEPASVFHAVQLLTETSFTLSLIGSLALLGPVSPDRWQVVARERRAPAGRDDVDPPHHALPAAGPSPIVVIGAPRARGWRRIGVGAAFLVLAVLLPLGGRGATTRRRQVHRLDARRARAALPPPRAWCLPRSAAYPGRTPGGSSERWGRRSPGAREGVRSAPASVPSRAASPPPAALADRPLRGAWRHPPADGPPLHADLHPARSDRARDRTACPDRHPVRRARLDQPWARHFLLDRRPPAGVLLAAGDWSSSGWPSWPPWSESSALAASRPWKPLAFLVAPVVHRLPPLDGAGCSDLACRSCRSSILARLGWDRSRACREPRAEARRRGRRLPTGAA